MKTREQRNNQSFPAGSNELLDEVKPTKSLLFASMPCEIRTASVKRGTLRAMENSDPVAVAFRHLQCKKGINKSTNEIFGFLMLFSLTMLLLFSRNNENSDESMDLSNSILYIGLLICVLNIIPEIQNRHIYQDLSNKSLKWLEKNTNTQAIREVASCDYDNVQSIKKLYGFFKADYETSPQNLPSKVNRISRQEV